MKRTLYLRRPAQCAVGLCAALVFFVSANAGYGQSTKTAVNPYTGKPVVTQENPVYPAVKTIPADSPVRSDATGTATGKLPYLNYKGESDPVRAKAAWMADHPELYQHPSSNNLPETHYLSLTHDEMVASLKTADVVHVKSFIREVLDQPLPADFQLPANLRKIKSPEEGNLIISERYPEFAYRDGEEFLRAIAANPIRYMSMIRESKAIRQLFIQTDANGSTINK